MIVIDDKTLAATGLTYPTAVALMEPVEGELVVRITRCLEDVGYVPPPSPIEHGGGGLRRTYEEEPGAESVAPTIEPTIGRRSGPVGYTLAEVEELARQQRLQLVFTGSVYVLSGVLGGQKFYSSLPQVVGALKFGRW